MQITFTSRFGEPSHLATQGDYVYLVPIDYTAQRSHILEDTYYRANLISTTTKSLRESRIASTTVEGAGQAQEADVDAYIKAIEEAILRGATGEELLTEYEHYIFHFQEPATQIAEYKRSKEDPKNKQGRRPNAEKVEYLRLLLDPMEATGEPVHVHTLLTIPREKKSFNAVARFMNPVGRYRVLKRSENVGWRDARPKETTMYHAMVRYRILQWLEPFVKNGLYGTVFKDGKFPSTTSPRPTSPGRTGITSSRATTKRWTCARNRTVASATKAGRPPS